MAQDPRRNDPLQDEAAGWRRLLPSGADWMDDEQWAAYLAGEPVDPDLDLDPDEPPEVSRAELAAIVAECRQITEDEARAAALAARMGTTGALAAIGAALRAAAARASPAPRSGSPASTPGPAGAFATGMVLDAAPGGLELALFAADAAGTGDRYPGASDDELVGAICAWDRAEAHAAARKHAAIAEFIRRRPLPGCPLEGPAQMPAAWEEFARTSWLRPWPSPRAAAEVLLDLSWDLEVKLPGTKAAFRSGILQAEQGPDHRRTPPGCWTPEEARAAEALVLDRAGRLTPGGLRAAIARAVMQVAPDKARKRREEAAKDARVERWAEDSGNAALVGRELPPAEVLAADQRVTWWAQELRKAGLDGIMDELRARAYLDILLGNDSRPGRRDRPGPCRRPADRARRSTGRARRPAAGAGSRAGVIPAGFAGRLNLTIPLATLLDLADRPGELAGIGPIDPA